MDNATRDRSLKSAIKKKINLSRIKKRKETQQWVSLLCLSVNNIDTHSIKYVRIIQEVSVHFHLISTCL